MRKLIVGNWKMNGTSRDMSEIIAIAELSGMHAAVDAALCLPATLIDVNPTTYKVHLH